MAYTATAIGDWDSTKPAGTEAPSVLDDALREVKVCVENEIYQTGHMMRAQFKYKDADEIYIEPGLYDLRGTSDQALYWDTQLTFQFGSAGSNAASSNLTASAWHYLYIDDSAVVTLGARLLTASELLNSTTAPTWTVAKHGWYNGSDRCIGAFLTDGSSNLLAFYHDGGRMVIYDTDVADLGATDIDTTWTDVTLTIPSFCSLAVITILSNQAGGAATTVYWRTNGSSSAGQNAGYFNHVGQISTLATVDATWKIEVKNADSGSQTIAVNTNGYGLPIGM